MKSKEIFISRSDFHCLCLYLVVFTLSASYVCLIYPDDDKLQGGAEVDIQFCALTERQPNISDKHKSIMHTYHRVSLDVI